MATNTAQKSEIEQLRELVDSLRQRIAEQDLVIAEQARIIGEQARIIAEQGRIIEEWKRGHRVRPRRGGKKVSTSERKRPGRAKGHEAAQRPMPDEVHTEADRTASTCNGCASEALAPTGATKEILVEHIIPARVEVERNILHEYLCGCCGELQWSKLPPEYGPEPVPGQPLLGPSVLATAVKMRYDLGLSFGKVVRHLDEHVGLKVTAGGLYRMLERAARRTEPVAEEILERALMSLYLNMDETIWWEDGKRLWAWIMANLDLSYFHIDKRRGHEVIEQLLCEKDEHGEIIANYEGVVVSDFMGAYRTCAWMVHQWCWVHLLRDAHKAAEMDPCPRTETFRDRLCEIYHAGLLAQQSQDPRAQHGVRVRLGKLLADTDLARHKDVARLQHRAFTEFHGMLRFMGEPGIPAHNNQGELDARALVLFRKIIFGTRSERGTEVHAHFMSLTQTARKQGVDLGDFIPLAIAAHQSGTPPPSLFVN